MPTCLISIFCELGQNCSLHEAYGWKSSFSGWSWEVVSRGMCACLCSHEREYVYFLKRTCISKMEIYLYSFLLSCLKLLENSEIECRQMWILYKWNLGLELSCLVILSWQPSPYANGCGRHPLLSGTKMLNPLLPCVFAPIPPQLFSLPGSVEEPGDCLERIYASRRHQTGQF